MLPVTRALLSVSDKSGLTDLAAGLVALGVEVLSTGGTEKHLLAAGIPVTPVADVTGFPEMLDGRVKTLHPRIHGAILADRSKSEHLAALDEHEIGRIDLVVVNLYPFEKTIENESVAEAEAIEMIDIGGPSMIRAAAKNFAGVIVVVDPADYGELLAALAGTGKTVPSELRRRFAAKAFAHTARYDSIIAGWFARTGGGKEVEFPDLLTLSVAREIVPRYGENPHQPAAVYRTSGGRGLLGGMTQLQGKELSWNNLLDADAARKLVALFAAPAVVLVKHNNPCGVGRGVDLVAAYRRAFASDPISAFGGILAANRPVDEALVAALGDLFLEVLIAPEVTAGARAALVSRKNLRLLLCPTYAPAPTEIEWRGVDGGFLAQTPDAFADDSKAWTAATKRQPGADERRALEFAWSVARYTKSNAIVIANADGDQTLGIGAGQMSRVDSCRLAIEKARAPLAGAVAASDAFFPFRDGVDVLVAAGITAIVQPGGSKRDDEIVAAADEHGIAMLFTGRRHFRH